MTNATQSARNDEDRPFSRRTAAVIGITAFAALIALALYVHYATLASYAGFLASLTGIFLLQGIATLCMIDALRLPRAMRSGGLWAAGRVAAFALVAILGGLVTWGYDNWVAVSATVFGVIDLWLVDDSR